MTGVSGRGTWLWAGMAVAVVAAVSVSVFWVWPVIRAAGPPPGVNITDSSSPSVDAATPCSISEKYVATKSGKDRGGPYKETVLRFRSLSTSPCVIDPGALRVRALLPGGHAVTSSALLWGSQNSPQHPQPVTLQPGQSYDISLQWTPSTVARCLGPATLSGFRVAFNSHAEPTKSVHTPPHGFCAGDDVYLKLPKAPTS